MGLLDKLSNLYENFTIDSYNLECIKYLYNNIKYLDKSDIELSNINVLDNLDPALKSKIDLERV